MRGPPTWGFLVLLAACDARISGGNPELADAGLEMLGPWSPPAKVSLAASPTLAEDDVTLSSNTLEMIFAVDDPNGKNGKDLYYSSRTGKTMPWSTASLLPFNSTTQSDETPRFSADDKVLYFASGRGGNGTLDIYSVTHTAPDATTWGTPTALASVNTTGQVEKWYMPCAANPNQYIMVQSTTANGTDLVEGTLNAGAPALLTKLNSAQNETGTFLTPDCLTIYFASARPPSTMIYTSHRNTLGGAWSDPAPVIDFAIPGGNGNQEDPWMSADGRTFVFASDAAGTKDIYISSR